MFCLKLHLGQFVLNVAQRPRVLNIPASEELLAIEHEDVLKFNGFEIEIHENAPIGQRIQLVAMPISKSTKKTEFTFEGMQQVKS